MRDEDLPALSPLSYPPEGGAQVSRRKQVSRRADGDTPAGHQASEGISAVCGGTRIRALLTLSWAVASACSLTVAAQYGRKRGVARNGHLVSH